MAIYEHEHDPQCMIIDLHLAEQCEYSEPDVVVVVHPNDEGVSPRHDEPLSYVEFGVVDQQRPLDVFLDHKPDVKSSQVCTVSCTACWLPGLLGPGPVVHNAQDPLQSVADGDPPASAGAAWLDNPQVEDSIHLQLSGANLPQLLQCLSCLYKHHSVFTHQRSTDRKLKYFIL